MIYLLTTSSYSAGVLISYQHVNRLMGAPFNFTPVGPVIPVLFGSVIPLPALPSQPLRWNHNVHPSAPIHNYSAPPGSNPPFTAGTDVRMAPGLQYLQNMRAANLTYPPNIRNRFFAGTVHCRVGINYDENPYVRAVPGHLYLPPF